MGVFVNVPGGKFDTAGRGVAAAQQYRQGEQRMKAVDFEMDLATRKVEFDEQQLTFEREQLASQQEAEADILLGQAIESGTDVGDGGAYREALKRASPRFRTEMAQEFGRATRLKAQQAEIEEIAAEIELTPETQAKVQSGELVDPGAIKRSMAGERRKIAHAADQEESRAGALEAWQAWTKDPLFDMPDEDDEAYGDVMEILGELTDGAATNDKTNYRKLQGQLTFLTTKGMRDAARAVLQREVGGVDVRGMPKGTLGNAAQSETFQSRAAGEYVDQRGDADQAARNADVPGGKTTHGPESPPGAAPTAQPAAQPKPKTSGEIGAGDVAPPVAPEVVDLKSRAMKNLGMTKIPAPNTPERLKLAAEMARLEKEATESANAKATKERTGLGNRLGGRL